MAQERLQKILARGGIASRRAAEEIILAGRVRVNGEIVTELGTKADPRNDKVELDGKRVIAEDAIYVILHKPRGVVSTMSDPEGRPTVATSLAPFGARLFPVGRLDFATSGALLATNDGDFSEGLLHPKRAVPKTYVVKVNGIMEKVDLDRWRAGVTLDDGPTKPAEANFLRHEGDKTWFELTIKEGRNQQIRRMGDATGFSVMRLSRISFAGITTEGLTPGDARLLTRDELYTLKKAYDVPRKLPSSEGVARAAEAASLTKRRPPVARPRDTADERPTRGARPEARREGGFGPPEARDERPTTARGPRSEAPRSYDRSTRPTSRGPRPEARDERPTRPTTRGPARDERPTAARGPRSDSPRAYDRPDTRGPRPETRDERPARPASRGPRPDTRGPRPETRDERPARPASRDEARHPSRAERPERPTRSRPGVRGPSQDDRAPRPDARGPRPGTRGPSRDDRGPRPDTRGPSRDDRAPRPNTRGPRPDTRGPSRDDRAPRPNTRGPRPDARGPSRDDRGPRPDARGPSRDDRAPRPDTRGPRPDARGPSRDDRAPRPDTRGPRPDTRGPARDDRGPRPDTRGPAPGRGGPSRGRPAPGGRRGGR